MQSQQNSRFMVFAIAGALVAWGVLLAVGAYMAPSDEGQSGDFRKLWVVAAMVAGFLLLWGGVLAIRARKVRQQHEKDRQSESVD